MLQLNNGFGGLLKRKWKSIAISIVILLEVVAIAVVATHAWVETVSSIKITNENNTEGTIDTYVFTDATIGGTSGTIDLGKYFKQAGDMHLAPASSADGVNMFFPKAGDASLYRKGDTSDMNTSYLSATFRLKADTNADFFFEQTPTVDNNNIRVSVTYQSEGSTDAPETKIYANTGDSYTVVNNTSGGTGTATVKAFSSSIKGTGTENRLFAVGANETKIVTINIWLQKVSGDMDSVMSASQAITNLGITSSLTPRHITLIPTPTWDANSPTYYAWCCDASNGADDKLFKLELDENEHYSFDYPGNYRKTTFVRAVPGCNVPEGEYDSWPFVLSTNNNDHDDNHYWNQTVDTTIPNDPIDPTYIIETISGGTNSKSTGSWHDPATITVATVTDQSSWGAVSATSYIGSNTSSNVMEQTNTNNPPTVHTNTVHAWPGMAIKLEATAAANYAFVGWYTNAEGTGTAASTSATFTTTAPSTASEVTYYAKFKETRTLTIYRYLDDSSSSASCGTITIGGTNSTSGASISKTVDKGSSVSFSASAATGYQLIGIKTTASATGTTATSPLNPIDSNTTYYAFFKSNTHDVSVSVIGSTGGEVQFGDDTSTKGTSFTQSDVKYNSSVTINAIPAKGYKFVGWYSTSDGTGTATSTDASYTFTMGNANVTYYAKFAAESYYLKASWNSWSETQDQLTGTGNELTFVQELDPGQYQFKIFGGGSHWSNAYEYKYNYNGSTYLGASGGDTLNSSNTTGNMQLNTGTPAKYTFHFNKSTKKFWITKVDVDYHVVGDINGGWSTDDSNKMTRVGSTDEYTFTVKVNGSKSFKILTSSGTWYSNGYGYHDGYYGASGGDTFNTSGGNCTMTGSNKNYVFHFDISTQKFWITDS